MLMHGDCSQTNWLLGRYDMSCDVKYCNSSFVIRMENVKLTSRTKFSSVSSVFLIPEKMYKVISYNENLFFFSYCQCLD